MIKSMLAALAVGAVSLVPQPAYAGTDSRYEGGCRLGWLSSAGTWTAVVSSATVVYSEGTPGDNPVSATVTCFVTVNGVTAVEAPFSGTAVVAGAQEVRFTAGAGDTWLLCETVDYTSNATPTETLCYDSIGSPVPQPVNDLIDAICQVSCHGPIFDPEPIDPIVCPLLAQLDPFDVPGVVEIDPWGDVFVRGLLVYDCPPYEDGA